VSPERTLRVLADAGLLPIWAQIEREIPWQFTDNGFSTPIPLRLFRGPLACIATRYSPIEARVGRVHDWLFWYGRLPGAPLGTESYDMLRANALAGDMLDWWGYERTARLVQRALDRFGGASWRHAAATMQRMGDVRYADYLARLDSTRPTAP